MSLKTGLAPSKSSDNASYKTDLNSLSDSIELARQFTTIVKALASDSEYRHVAELIDQIPRLEQLVRSKDGEIESLKRKNLELVEGSDKVSSQLIRTYEREYDEFKDEKSALRGRIVDLEKLSKSQGEDVKRLLASEGELKEKGRQVKGMWMTEKENLSQANKKIESLEGEVRKASLENSRLNNTLSHTQAELSGAKKSLQKAEDRVLVLERELHSRSESLKEIEGLGATLREECWEEPVASIEEVWRSLHRLVESYFGKDLEERALQASDTWAMLRAPVGFQHRIPLPASNSSAAKSTRTVVILAILARLIDKHIFHPTYLLEDESGIRDILLRQAALHKSRESFTRALLLNMFPEEQETRAERMVAVVLQKIGPYVRNLLPPEEMNKCQEELRTLIRVGRDVWVSIQRLKERLEPSFELVQFENFEWETIQLKGISNERQSGNRASKAGRKDDEAVLLVFPRICLVEDEDPYPLSRGTVITESQVEKATQEVQKVASTPPVRKLLQPRARRHNSEGPSQKATTQAGAKGAHDFLAPRV